MGYSYNSSNFKVTQFLFPDNFKLDFQVSAWHNVEQRVDLTGGDRFYKLNARGGTKVGDVWYGDFLKPTF